MKKKNGKTEKKKNEKTGETEKLKKTKKTGNTEGSPSLQSAIAGVAPKECVWIVCPAKFSKSSVPILRWSFSVCLPVVHVCKVFFL